MNLQIQKLHKKADELNVKYGSAEHSPIYGAGKINKPKLLFLFMNPTARNYSSEFSWTGIRAPWIGTKNIWKMFCEIGYLDTKIYGLIQKGGKDVWSPKFAESVYSQVARKSAYITNLAKCTQIDARPLSNSVFKDYLPNTLEEIVEVNPSAVVCFGNQVSSVLLGKNVKVSDYSGVRSETLKIGSKTLVVYPVYYPVGQGMRNMGKAVSRIKRIITATH